MFTLVYITCGGKKEAVKIAELLVREKLVACVNYFPVSSIYRWKGRVERDDEYVLISKSTREKFTVIRKRVREVHSYEKPAILSIPVSDGDEDFLDWVLSETDSKRT